MGTTIARELGIPCSTLRGWLARIADRGVDNIYDMPTPNRKYILDDTSCEQIREWMSKSPTEFGYETATWNGLLIGDMVLKKLGKNVNPRTLCRTLCRIELSFSKKRPVFH